MFQIYRQLQFVKLLCERKQLSLKFYSHQEVFLVTAALYIWEHLGVRKYNFINFIEVFTHTFSFWIKTKTMRWWASWCDNHRCYIYQNSSKGIRSSIFIENNSKHVWMRLKLNLHDCWSWNLTRTLCLMMALVLINFYSSFFTQHVIICISSRIPLHCTKSFTRNIVQ